MRLSHDAASAMPGGSELTGESGRAHSAKPPLRPQERLKRASGVAIRTASASLRKRPGSANGSESAAVTIA